MSEQEWDEYWLCKYMSAAQGVLAELNSAGLDVNTVSGLAAFPESYLKVVSILMKWLPVVTYSPLKEEIVRMLASPRARQASHLLVQEFTRATYSLDPEPASHDDANIRWCIGLAIGEMADDGLYDDIVRLVRDEEYGPARQQLVLALGKMKRHPEVVDVLVDRLYDVDPWVTVNAIKALRKLKAAQAMPAVKCLLDHPEEPVRKEAQKWIRWFEALAADK